MIGISDIRNYNLPLSLNLFWYLFLNQYTTSAKIEKNKKIIDLLKSLLKFKRNSIKNNTKKPKKAYLNKPNNFITIIYLLPPIQPSSS